VFAISATVLLAAAVAAGHQQSGRWGAGLRRRPLMGSARVLPKLTVPIAVAEELGPSLTGAP
jgi:hypothetical protein